MATRTKKPAKPKYHKPFPGPLVLCILDGFGERPIPEGNAIAAAHTPTLDWLHANAACSRLLTHGGAVGLPEGQMGNSEVGHMNLGAGRVLQQHLERIQTDMGAGRFEEMPNWQKFFRKAIKCRTIHLFGLVSDGGVHSHMDHAIGLAKLLSPHVGQVYIHAILDGRDTAPKTAESQLPAFAARLSGLKNVNIASICGRFYAMDRDNRWERTQKAFRMYTLGEAAYRANTVEDAIAAAYARGETDEFVEPTALPPLEQGGMVQDGDGLFFFNFRADRMRQIVRTFIDDSRFEAFTRAKIITPAVVGTMTEYDATFKGRVIVMYPPGKPPGMLGEIISKAGLKQLRIAETEKYAHVTFFFNGGEEKPYKGESRILIPSPKVRTYDLQPQMSLPELTEAMLAAIKDGKFDLIVCNIANGDMVGHTGIFEAGVKAVEAIDLALGRMCDAVMESGGELIVTADHGNVEEMTTPDGHTSTNHSLNPVPFIYLGRPATVQDGALCDVAPTILTLLDLPTPPDMTGQCLVTFTD